MALPPCGFAVFTGQAGELPLSVERRAKGLRERREEGRVQWNLEASHKKQTYN